LISRPVCELDRLRRLLAALAEEGVPVLISIAPLRSFEEADCLAHEVPDIAIPPAALRVMQQAGRDAGRAGIEMAAELLAEAGPLVQGTVLALPGTDPAALDRLLDAAP
jgi:homocysteine S-methyltransferase